MKNLFRPNVDSASSTWEGSQIKLKNGHLIIHHELADTTIKETRQVYAVYYDNLKAILLAPDSDETFKSAHECVMLFVKTKNLAGDRSISIQEFIVDNEINDTDRDLEFMSAPGMQMIHISM